MGLRGFYSWRIKGNTHGNKWVLLMRNTWVLFIGTKEVLLMRTKEVLPEVTKGVLLLAGLKELDISKLKGFYSWDYIVYKEGEKRSSTHWD